MAIWPSHDLARQMMHDAERSEDADVACHVKALLERVRLLERERERVFEDDPDTTEAAASLAAFVCEKRALSQKRTDLRQEAQKCADQIRHEFGLQMLRMEMSIAGNPDNFDLSPGTTVEYCGGKCILCGEREPVIANNYCEPCFRFWSLYCAAKRCLAHFDKIRPADKEPSQMAEDLRKAIAAFAHLPIIPPL